MKKISFIIIINIIFNLINFSYSFSTDYCKNFHIDGTLTNAQAITCAIENGDLNTVKKLIRNGHNVNKGTPDAPVLIAAENNNFEILRYLTEKGADLNKRTGDDSFTILHIAVENNNYKMVKYLIDKGVDVKNSGTFSNNTIHKASVVGNPDILELLIDNGSDVNCCDDYGYVPLHFVKNMKTAKILIDHKANVNTHKTENGDTPLHTAIKADNIELRSVCISKTT